MYLCIILHNMVLEDEIKVICDYDENESVLATPLKIGGEEYTTIRATICNGEVH